MGQQVTEIVVVAIGLKNSMEKNGPERPKIIKNDVVRNWSWRGWGEGGLNEFAYVFPFVRLIILIVGMSNFWVRGVNLGQAVYILVVLVVAPECRLQFDQ